MISVCYFLIKKIEYINDVIRDRNDVIIHEGNEIIGDPIDRWDDFVKCSEMYRPYEHSIWFNWSTRCRCKLHFNFFFFRRHRFFDELFLPIFSPNIFNLRGKRYEIVSPVILSTIVSCHLRSLRQGWNLDTSCK